MKNKLLIFFLLNILLLNSCDDGIVSTEEKPAGLYAKIIDINNNPLYDVDMHYIFYLGVDIISRNWSFRYTLANADSVTIRIYDCFNNEVVTLLKNYPQHTGNYSIFYNADSITNGIYFCTITGNTINQNHKFFILNDNIDELKMLPPFKKSNASGNIQVTYSAMGIGNHFTYDTGSNQLSLTVSDSVKIILSKNGYKIFSESVKFDTTKVLEKTFKLLPL
jgi:hypothetical protein